MRVLCAAAVVCAFLVSAFSPVPAAAAMRRGAERERHVAITARENEKALERAGESLDFDALSAAAGKVLAAGKRRGVEKVLSVYAAYWYRAAKIVEADAIYQAHGHMAGQFRSLTSVTGLKALAKLQKSHREWPARLLALDAAAFCAADQMAMALVGLKDKEPIVARRAVILLRKTKTRAVVEEILACFEAAEAKAAKKNRTDDWSRTALTCSGVLAELLRVDLVHARDYRNYLVGRQEDSEEELFKGRKKRTRERTALTLFGRRVTGRNIVFILDVSGSMLTIDPDSGGDSRAVSKRGKRTSTDRDRKQDKKKRFVEAQRLTRAKRELSRVIEALPDGSRFNIIAYSTVVRSWKDQSVASSRQAKKQALDFVAALEAEGVTVTDRALETAFSDLKVDTIYLVTDGAPTHVGGTGKQLPRDSNELMQSILRRVRSLNFLRQVRVFTLGFRDAEERFLKRLARDNGGKYVRIR